MSRRWYLYSAYDLIGESEYCCLIGSPMLYLQINIDVKVQEVEGRDTPAAEAKKIGATWVVFDK